MSWFQALWWFQSQQTVNRRSMRLSTSSNRIKVLHIFSQCRDSMLTQQQQQQEQLAKREKLEDATQCAIIEYILHHRDQKFALYCNNNDSSIFGKPGTPLRERVRQFEQDLLRRRNRAQLHKLIDKYQPNILLKRERDKMLHSGRSLKKMPPPTTKATKSHPGVQFLDDDDDMYDEEYVEDDDIDVDNPPPLFARGADTKSRQQCLSRHVPPSSGETDCMSFFIIPCCLSIFKLISWDSLSLLFFSFFFVNY